MFAGPHRSTWRSWAGTVTGSPARTVRPRDGADVVSAVRAAAARGGRVRPRGSGHSSVPLATSPDTVLDLTGLTGIELADRESGLVAVRAGTTVRDLNAELDSLGLALSMMGDVDSQTIAGAMATGTHGTGRRLPGMPSQIRSLDVVLADGTLTSWNPRSDPEAFAAARLNLGALGVVTRLTLQCEPAFALAAEEFPEPVEQTLERFADDLDGYERAEFYWFAHGANALVKRYRRVPEGTALAPLSPLRRRLEYDVVENAAFGAACRLARAVPSWARSLNGLSSALLPRRSYVDRSHRALVTERRVRFVESEYGVPLEALGWVLEQLRRHVPRLRHPVMFPAEVRAADADDVWLSPAYGRATAYVSVQQYAGMPYEEYFRLFESIVTDAGARPHWGKLHSLEAAGLRERHPRFDDFRRVRAQVDPDGVFGNDYLDRILGP